MTNYKKLIDAIRRTIRKKFPEDYRWEVCDECGSTKFKLLTVTDMYTTLPLDMELVCAECGDWQSGIDLGCRDDIAKARKEKKAVPARKILKKCRKRKMAMRV
jgi:hypothetical protein